MNEHEQPQQQVNPEDPSTLLPIMPKISLSRGVLIGGGIIVLFVILTALHFSMKPKNAPMEVTTETPNGGLVTITPPAGTPVAVPEIVKDKDGKEYLTGEIIVGFHASVSVEDAKKAIVDAGGTVKQHFTEYPGFLVGVPEGGSEGVNKAILRFKTIPGVTSAEPNYLIQAPAK